MVDVASILKPERMLLNAKASSRRQVFQCLAKSVTQAVTADETTIVETLCQREKLGSTGIGGGIAIPHARLGELRAPIGSFARLAEPVDFDSIDDEPVDLVMMLLAPETSESDHLKSLAKMARILRNERVCSELRETTDPLRALELLSSGSHSEAA
ncbi:MAG: PTS sugar transporter subunit IIA [Pseudomonadota bacterium]